MTVACQRINYLIIGVIGYPNLLFVLLFFNLTEIEGLKRKLTNKLGPSLENLVPAWQIGECVAIWWRPNFKTYMYSYCPPHITKPKECRVLYMVQLSDRGYFEVPGDLALLAVPMFQLCDNVQKYGSINSSIPQQLSRFEFRMINK
ncbi:pre-mRNA cleavage factor Im 25 kDa subunit 2-like [Arachis duranensis]|uniref:Pre-mRNA cleavage factor Im 25 kDa subunit 2-like n=1 Tax=Arachis duranensis TaxID=130453 RepID=A0A6P4DHJ8_ARADU|nr:pre-mRNA cleavage factor Im 25 kDa subunit 2-like [Arachis duranensis]